jgi:hypothetical protein
MENSEIPYKIILYSKGCVKVQMPSLKGLSWLGLLKKFKRSSLLLPSGIKDINLDQFKSTILITYDPDKIDILEFLESMSSNTELKEIVNG